MSQLEKIAAFYGDIESPMLAPRGVCLHQHVLAVSDTGQNRVLIWRNFSFQSHQPPDIILGEREKNDPEKNVAEKVSASSLRYPSGIWTNGEILMVADAWNHRVLIWHKLPTQNFQEADVVIGQADFISNEANIAGIGKPPSAHSLYWPYGLFSNGKELWIADTGNRRILYFEQIPRTQFAAADKVIGQVDFTEKDYDHQNAVWPYSVKLNSNGAMAVADTQYYRVLIWRHWENALTRPADLILGQKNINDNGQNQYRLKPNAHSLNWVYDACFFKAGIAVADTGNSRLILHHAIPEQHDPPADLQIGQPNFETHGESSLSMTSQVENEIYWPFSVSSHEDILAAADTGNHRILFYKTV